MDTEGPRRTQKDTEGHRRMQMDPVKEADWASSFRTLKLFRLVFVNSGAICISINGLKCPKPTILIKDPPCSPYSSILCTNRFSLQSATLGNLYKKSHSGLISGIFSTNFGLKMNYFQTNTPRMIHSDICFHMRWVGASEYHFDAYKCIRMSSNGKNAFSGFFGFPPKNFSSPYLGSPTWHRSHSVLKIIV